MNKRLFNFFVGLMFLCSATLPIQGMSFVRRMGGSVAAAARMVTARVGSAVRGAQPAAASPASGATNEVASPAVRFTYHPKGSIYGRDTAAIIAHDGENFMGHVLYGYDERKTTEHKNGHIDMLEVEREVRGRGIGSDLLEQAVNDMRLRGIERVTLLVSVLDMVSKKSLRQFYEHNGFRRAFGRSSLFDDAKMERYL